MGRLSTFGTGIVLFGVFFGASISVIPWFVYVGGLFARSNQLSVYCDIWNTGPLSVYVWEPARSLRDNEVRVVGSSGAIVIDRETGAATISANDLETPLAWSPDSLRDFALRCGCSEEIVTTEAASELFGAIERIRKDGRSAMYYKSELFNYFDDRDVPRMTHWEAHGPGYRWMPVYWRVATFGVLWFCCQAAAIYGIVRLVRFVDRKLSAHSDAQTPCPRS